MSLTYTKTQEISSGQTGEYYYFGGDVSLNRVPNYSSEENHLFITGDTENIWESAGDVRFYSWHPTGFWNTSTTGNTFAVSGLWNYGRSISNRGDYIAVGAAIGDGSLSSGDVEGVVAIYYQDNLEQWSISQIISSDQYTGQFGIGTSINDDTLIVGDDSYATGGAAIVYTRSGSTWSYSTVITASDTVYGDKFGRSVALDQNTLAIGAPKVDEANVSNDSASNVGVVYIYTRSGNSWTLSAKISADDGERNDYFGTSVGLYGTRLVVGAPGWDTPTPSHAYGLPYSNAGAVYIYDKQTNGSWTQTATISGRVMWEFMDGGWWENHRTDFGRSVDLYDDQLAVGGMAADVAYEDGVVYTYTLSGGTTIATAQASGDPHVITFDGIKYTL